MGRPGRPGMIINLYAAKTAAISSLDADMYFDGGVCTPELRDAHLYATKAEAEAVIAEFGDADVPCGYSNWEAVEVICHATPHKEA